MLTGDYVPPPELADQARSPIKETLQRFKRPVRRTGAKAMPVKARVRLSTPPMEQKLRYHEAAEKSGLIASYEKDGKFMRFGILDATMRILFYAYHIALK